MQMEELTKTQLILLALLVSFVTSIATGIATVSLIDQAPPEVTQTIHKVVERTVETVTPATNPEPSEEVTVITEEKTVIVREEDAITEAITKASQSVVRLRGDVTTIPEGGGEEDAVVADTFLGMGVVLDPTGTIVTTNPLVTELPEVRVVLPGDITLAGSVEQAGEGSTVIPISIVGALAEYNAANPEGTIALVGAVLGDATSLGLGQKVIGVGGDRALSVQEGIISNVFEGGFEATVPIVSSGMPLVNLFGEFVGIHIGLGGQGFAPLVLVAAPAA